MQTDTDNPIMIHCPICDVMIAAGPKKQRLSNIRRHLTNSSSHQSKVISSKGRDNISSESVANLEIEEACKLKFIAEAAPGVFKRRGDVFICNYCVGPNKTLFVQPEHGSMENNVKSHLNSKQHIAAVKGGKNKALLMQCLAPPHGNRRQPLPTVNDRCKYRA